MSDLPIKHLDKVTQILIDGAWQDCQAARIEGKYLVTGRPYSAFIGDTFIYPLSKIRGWRVAGRVHSRQ